MKKDRFAALLGAWCLGGSLYGWTGAVATVVIAAVALWLLDRK